MLIATEALAKHYGAITALDDCTFAVQQGEILGLLGPNGAGKTTLLRLLLGYLKPTAGRAAIDGLDCYRQSVEVHRRLTYLPGEARFSRRLTGRETLEFLAALRRESSLARALEIAERLRLDLSRRVGEMSTGMRQKLGLAAALAPDVPLLVLDEPTENLDPTVRSDVLALVREARTAGRTVLFSSHVLSEVEQTCDRVILLKEGRLVESIRVADVLRQHRIRARLTGPLQPAPPELAAGLQITQQSAQEVEIITPGELTSLLGWLAEQPLAELQIEPVGLRTVYARLHEQEPAA